MKWLVAFSLVISAHAQLHGRFERYKAQQYRQYGSGPGGDGGYGSGGSGSGAGFPDVVTTITGGSSTFTLLPDAGSGSAGSSSGAGSSASSASGSGGRLGGPGPTPVIDPSFSCPTSTRIVTTTRYVHTTVTNVIHSVAESIQTKYVTATVVQPTPKTITHTVTRFQKGSVQSAQRVIVTTAYTVGTNFLTDTRYRTITDHVSYTDTVNNYVTQTETVPSVTTITAVLTTYKTFHTATTVYRTVHRSVTFTRTAVTTSVVDDSTTLLGAEVRTLRTTTTKDVFSTLPVLTVTHTVTVCDLVTVDQSGDNFVRVGSSGGGASASSGGGFTSGSVSGGGSFASSGSFVSGGGASQYGVHGQLDVRGGAGDSRGSYTYYRV